MEMGHEIVVIWQDSKQFKTQIPKTLFPCCNCPCQNFSLIYLLQKKFMSQNSAYSLDDDGKQYFRFKAFHSLTVINIVGICQWWKQCSRLQRVKPGYQTKGNEICYEAIMENCIKVMNTVLLSTNSLFHLYMCFYQK